MKEMEAVNNAPDVKYRFVDDSRIVCKGIKDGWAWVDGKMVYSKVKEEEDKKSTESVAQKTAKEVRKILDSFRPELKSTMETCDDFENKRCATLDYEMYFENDKNGIPKIKYSYFEKSVCKPTVINKDSVLGRGKHENSCSYPGGGEENKKHVA